MLRFLSHDLQPITCIALALALETQLASAQTQTARAAPFPAEQTAPTDSNPVLQPPPPDYAHGAYPAHDFSTPPPPLPKEHQRSRRLSLSVSALHLLSSMGQLTGELRLSKRFGAALITGYGHVPSEDAATGTPFNVRVLEAGSQLAFYPTKSFEGLHLGTEVLFIRADWSDRPGEFPDPVAYVVEVGPLLGYKLILRPGITFVAQGGMRYVMDVDDNQAESNESVIPLLNLKAGWSF